MTRARREPTSHSQHLSAYSQVDQSALLADRNAATFNTGRRSGTSQRTTNALVPVISFEDNVKLPSQDPELTTQRDPPLGTSGVFTWGRDQQSNASYDRAIPPLEPEVCCTSVNITIGQHRSDDKFRDIGLTFHVPPRIIEGDQDSAQSIRWVGKHLRELDTDTLAGWAQVQDLSDEDLTARLATLGHHHPYRRLHKAGARVSVEEWHSRSQSRSSSSSDDAAEIIVKHAYGPPTKIMAAPGERITVHPRKSRTQSVSERPSSGVTNGPYGLDRERQLLSALSRQANDVLAEYPISGTGRLTEHDDVPTQAETGQTAYTNAELVRAIKKLADAGDIIVPSRQDQSTAASGKIPSRLRDRLSSSHVGPQELSSVQTPTDAPTISKRHSRHPEISYIPADESLFSRGPVSRDLTTASATRLQQRTLF